jgi:hypothetical protein
MANGCSPRHIRRLHAPFRDVRGRRRGGGDEPRVDMHSVREGGAGEALGDPFPGVRLGSLSGGPCGGDSGSHIGCKQLKLEVVCLWHWARARAETVIYLVTDQQLFALQARGKLQSSFGDSEVAAASLAPPKASWDVCVHVENNPISDVRLSRH